MTATNTLNQRIFSIIRDHFKRRARDLHDIVCAGCSFEEWFNWETFLACCGGKFESVQPRPAYHVCGAKDCNLFGDLLVQDAGTRILMEVGVVHDSTGDKWLDKLNADRAKLMQQFSPDVTTFQLIACASLSDIRSDSKWTQWLARLTFSFDSAWGDESFPLEPTGNARFTAWSWTWAATAAT